MLIKVSLIVAILLGIGTVVVTHFQIAPKIAELQENLTSTQGQLKTAQDEESKAKKEAKLAKEKADKTEKELTETAANLETATSKANRQEARANTAETDLNKTRGELTEAQRSLAAWAALGLPVEQIQKSLVDLAKANEANKAKEEENKLLLRKTTILQARLSQYEGDKDAKPTLPAGLKGKVLAVNPQWDFVVLDIGGNAGLVERGELLVNREGKLVAKLRVTSVEGNRSIANVLPEWRVSDVREGDVVMH